MRIDDSINIFVVYTYTSNSINTRGWGVFGVSDDYNRDKMVCYSSINDWNVFTSVANKDRFAYDGKLVDCSENAEWLPLEIGDDFKTKVHSKDIVVDIMTRDELKKFIFLKSL